ncbi:hypothetical protein M426DRAFT_12300 [Hypoxylon sp. CI-4A]|nr:hypothetical protein M426DRAFT_12300 [Hypoxylon sp. CI-4A]
MSDPQENGPKPVTGIPLGQGENPGIRQEIRDFQKNEDLWNLYLLGLSEFKRKDKDNSLSYFQVAGIHGVPYDIWPKKAWNKKLEGMKAPNDEPTGFCTHTSIIFLTWHRPYLALFESTLHDIITDIAQQFTAEEGKARYLAAAKTFRIPYWDWARRDLSVFPEEALITGKINVNMPATLAKALGVKLEGQVGQIDNPLYNFKFPSGIESEYKIHGKDTTQRYEPTNGGELSPDERNEILIESLTPFTRDVNSRVPVEGNLTERVTYILQSYDSFRAMTHNKWDPDREADNRGRLLGFGSIEDIHNTLHNLSGGSNGYMGHMTNPAIASFDPIFWLHHCNIDRLFAIWQGLHDVPGATDPYVSRQVSVEGTYITEANTYEDVKTPLAPFYKDSTNFWDSEGVRTTKTFGYAYPETQDWLYNNDAKYRESIVENLKKIYPEGSFAELVRAEKAGSTQPSSLLRSRAKTLLQVTKAEALTNATTLLQVADQKFTRDGLTPITIPQVDLPTNRDIKKLVPSNKYLEWLVNIRSQKHILGGDFTVHVFLGPVEEDNLALYSVSPNHVGTFSTFGQNENTGCAKCKVSRAAGHKVTGQIPLTIALAERYFAGLLDSLEPEDVTEYLKVNLHWEVVTGDGTRLHRRRDEVADLLVILVSNEVQIPEDPLALPIYAPNLVPYPEVTTKADGSSGRGEGTGFTDGTQL